MTLLGLGLARRRPRPSSPLVTRRPPLSRGKKYPGAVPQGAAPVLLWSAFEVERRRLVRRAPFLLWHARIGRARPSSWHNGRVRVLIITQRLPYTPNRGDRLRAFHQIHHLREHGWTVDILALVHDTDEASQAGAMRATGTRVETATIPHLRNKAAGVLSLPGNRPLTLTLLDSPELPAAIARVTSDGSPDVILACSSSMAAIAQRPPLASVPRVIDFVDVDSEKWSALGARSNLADVVDLPARAPNPSGFRSRRRQIRVRVAADDRA